MEYKVMDTQDVVGQFKESKTQLAIFQKVLWVKVNGYTHFDLSQ